MKNIIKFESFEANKTEEIDLNDAIEKIKSKWSDEDIIIRFDSEILEWVDDNWEEDGYDSEYDWYMEHNNGEAQDVIINEIIKWYQKEIDKNLTIDEHCLLFDKIKETYDCLDYL